MKGLMQDWPLLCHKIIDHAATYHEEREIVSRSVEGPMHRTNYRAIGSRARQVAKRLEKDGIAFGDRVATMAWNTWRHLEVWYGILGLGAVYHTLNPRLFPDQIAWIMNDAEDRFLFVDLTFLPVVEAVADRVPSLEKVVVLTDAAHMPETKIKNAVAYEDWYPRPTMTLPGANSTKRRRPACATPPARPAIRRVLSIRTARMSCTPWPRHSPICSTSPPATA